MPMNMPKVTDCSVSDCAYNDKHACHAMAITVGEKPSEPVCDTYFQSSIHGGVRDMNAGVGACKSYDCQHNTDFECMAPNVHIAMKGSQPDCLDFEPR
ncbi:MAG: DUF1540 domain-containing protein [Desulfuromonas sp.]|uniref:DUF1540 domain-containing protein n=1 Tax=Desulfuromonas sp. TaxID=892 RepID=UPI000CB3040A|nr:DUF1540 domain-containing protein [Desulfuromonas sp.]PLX84896.1 MAG: DUF1540 domain-containing protein [Desulfuromonas sp.]